MMPREICRNFTPMTDHGWQTARFQTSIGDMAVVWKPHPFLIRRILLPGDFPEDLPPEVFIDDLDSARFCEPLTGMIRLIQDTLAGTAAHVPWESLTWDGISDLERAVYAQTAAIPRGSLSTYKEIARRIGRPRACRFVGNALSKNPFPVLIPCHRVIRSDNKTGGFTGGRSLKQQLIDAEAVQVSCAL